MDPVTKTNPIRWLWTAAAGLATTLTGLGWDAIMHTRDHELASHEGVFTLSNPSHALFVAGLAVTALGVAGALVTTLGRPRLRRLPMTAVVAAVVLVAGGFGAWASVSTEEATHDAAGHDASASHAAAHAAMEIMDEGEDGAMQEAHHGSEKADVAGATAGQRAAAQALLDDTIAATAAYRDPAAAEDAGYRFGLVEKEVMALYHVPNLSYWRDGKTLDPERPESLLYARNPADDTLVLVGVVFRMEVAGVPGVAIGGPITVWHNHSHCLDSATRAEIPSAMAGSCPEGTEPHTGADMIHMWFTDDLATAFNGRKPPTKDLMAYQRSLAG